MALKPPQIRYLRGLAHPLKPVLLLGGKGVTPGVLKELEQALDDHELIKVRLSGADRAARVAELAQLVESSKADAVQTIGKIAVLYRRNDDQPQIALPKK
jgi:RNA-binding protein